MPMITTNERAMIVRKPKRNLKKVLLAVSDIPLLYATHAFDNSEPSNTHIPKNEECVRTYSDNARDDKSVN